MSGGPKRHPARSTAAFVLVLTSLGLVPGCGSTSPGSGGATGGSGGASVGSGGQSSGGAGSGSGGTTSGAVMSQSYVKASNTDAGDLFGFSTALSVDGNTLVIGANGEASSGEGSPADNSAANAGAVYVYSRSEGTWGSPAYLKASNSGSGDGFGTTVALSADGNTLAIGAPYESSAPAGAGSDQNDDSAPHAGAVYLFARNGAAWQQQAYLKASSGDADDFFGIAMALSVDGNLLAVGAEGEDGAGTGVDADQSDKTAYESGAVFVFSRTGTSWLQRDYIKASNAGVGDHFGGSVAVSADGNLLAVGAYWEDSNATDLDGDQLDDSAGSAGAVYVFGHDGSTWQQETYLKGAANDGNASDNFGAAVSLSADGGRLAVGAVGDPSAATGIDGDPAGSSMPYAGAAYLFERSGSSWQKSAYLKASNTGAGDEFGYHLQLSPDGETLVVGAALEGSGVSADQSDDSALEAGAAYVFRRGETSWTQMGYLKAPNVGAGDRFGWSVALSAGADTLAIGATREASASTGIDGTSSDDSAVRAGAVYVFDGLFVDQP